jgi:hypothetical protein
MVPPPILAETAGMGEPEPAVGDGVGAVVGGTFALSGTALVADTALLFSDDGEDYSDSKNLEAGTTPGQVISGYKIVSRVLNDCGTFYGVEFQDIVNMISVDKNTPTEIVQAISRYEAMLENSTQSPSVSSDLLPELPKKRTIRRTSEKFEPPQKKKKSKGEEEVSKRRSGRLSESSTRTRTYESDETDTRVSKKPKISSTDNKSFSREANQRNFNYSIFDSNLYCI